MDTSIGSEILLKPVLELDGVGVRKVERHRNPVHVQRLPVQPRVEAPQDLDQVHEDLPHRDPPPRAPPPSN